MSDPRGGPADRSWRTSDFDFELPESAIAQHPVERGQSRLLVVGAAEDSDRHRSIGDLAEQIIDDRRAPIEEPQGIQQ